ncbi:hypothetical protein [Micromonospora sp. NPDC047730]|uniref:hypothetical protein n=1 Tax=Micromonospora sp. NPDC047730 TaxID=3364253 RepID=UPI003715FB8A
MTLRTDSTPTKAVAAPSMAERIRAFVPDHAAIVLKPPPLGNSWTWSTPAGLWAIYDAGQGHFVLSGPGGTWTFKEPDEAVMARRLEDVLRALDAIPAAAQAAH